MPVVCLCTVSIMPAVYLCTVSIMPAVCLCTVSIIPAGCQFMVSTTFIILTLYSTESRPTTPGVVEISRHRKDDLLADGPLNSPGYVIIASSSAVALTTLCGGRCYVAMLQVVMAITSTSLTLNIAPSSFCAT